MSYIDESICWMVLGGVSYCLIFDVVFYVRGVMYSKNDEDFSGLICVLCLNNILLLLNIFNLDEVRRVLVIV